MISFMISVVPPKIDVTLNSLDAPSSTQIYIRAVGHHVREAAHALPVRGQLRGCPAEEAGRARNNGEMTEPEHGWPVTCSDCGASRDGLPDATACPSCGATSKTVHVSPHDVAAVSDELLGLTAMLDKRRPWTAKWNEVEAAYQAVNEVYHGGRDGGSAEWELLALSFFLACHELPEAIAADPQVPDAIKHKVRRAAGGQATLKLVADVDNTRKHSGRDPDKCHAHIGEIAWGTHAFPTMTIVRECPNKPVERVDVLAAATKALEDWRRIFSQHELSAPTLTSYVGRMSAVVSVADATPPDPRRQQIRVHGTEGIRRARALCGERRWLTIHVMDSRCPGPSRISRRRVGRGRGPNVGVSDDDDDLAGLARQRRGGLQALGTIIIVG